MPDRRFTRASWISAASVAVVVVLAYGLAPFWILVAAFAVMAALAWLLSAREGVSAYLLLLGVQIPQAEIVFRLALSDVFLLPVVVRAGIARLQGRQSPIVTTLMGPLVALAAVMAWATVVGAVRTRHLTSYVLFNKDAGIAFLIAGTFALLSQVRTLDDVRRYIDRFVTGVSVLNVVALCGVALSFAGIQNFLYYSTSNRLNGFMLNPSSYGALVTTAAMLELPRFVSGRRPSRWLPLLRGANLALLLAAAGCTLSRSSWLSVAAGAGGLILIWLCSRAFGRRSLFQWMAATLAFIVPTVALLWIAAAHSSVLATLQGHTATARAAELQSQLVGQCTITWDPELCAKVPPDLIEAERQRNLRLKEAPRSEPSPVAAPATTGMNPDGALMNSRGLDDRAAIIRAALQDYTASGTTRIFGIGLGTFLATSARTFGVPLIVHNTLVWFLVELGPLGLAVLLWLFVRTALNLWRTRLLPGWQGELSHGVAAALVAWLAFSLFNEALYLRQLWLLILAADRLCVLSQPAAQSDVADARG